ncbi:MAG: hypothetical protein AAF289_05285 [Cyanobacteria bacterium P01_A01_bin.135]
MPRLFTYTIPVDDGAAPNPFSGLCTLAICKPGIRRVAKVGDWVAGLGSKNAPSGDLSGRLVYAMRVEEILTLEAYDRRAEEEWPHRIPDITSPLLQRRLGDCIYDFSSAGEPRLRNSVHGPGNVKTDLGGRNALLSRDFYYFGKRAIPLSESLIPICHSNQGHRSTSNQSYFDEFVAWIRNGDWAPGQYGWPDCVPEWRGDRACGGCDAREKENQYDPAC